VSRFYLLPLWYFVFAGIPPQKSHEGHSSSPSHWRGQCSIMHSINIESRSFRSGSRNDALLLVMKAITICDKSDSYIRFMLKVFFLTVLSIDISFTLSLFWDPEKMKNVWSLPIISPSIFISLKNVCFDNHNVIMFFPYRIFRDYSVCTIFQDRIFDNKQRTETKSSFRCTCNETNFD